MAPHLVQIENLVRMGVALSPEQFAVLRENYGRIDKCSSEDGSVHVKQAFPKRHLDQILPLKPDFTGF